MHSDCLEELDLEDNLIGDCRQGTFRGPGTQVAV